MNTSFLTLIPKKSNALNVKDFRIYIYIYIYIP